MLKDMTLRELLANRAELRDTALEIVNSAEKEKRDLTKSEQSRYDSNRDQLDELEAEIKRVELEREEERKLPTHAIDSYTGLRATKEPDSNTALRHDQSIRSYIEPISRVDRDIGKIKPGAILRALATGPKNEQEKRALSSGIGTSGGYTVPDILAAEFIDAMRAKSVLSIAGARTVPLAGKTRFAVVESDPVPSWRSENTALDESDATFGAVDFKPKTLGVLCKVPRELLEDSINAEEILLNSLSKAMALELDRVGMIGDGAAGEPSGITEWPDVLEEAIATSPNYDHILTARTALLTENAEEPSSLLLHPRDEGTYSKLKDGQGLPLLRPPAISNLPFYVTTQLPITLGAGADSLMILGNFRDLLIGIRTELRIEVLREAFMSSLQYGYVAWMRLDFVLAHSESFCKITGVTA